MTRFKARFDEEEEDNEGGGNHDSRQSASRQDARDKDRQDARDEGLDQPYSHVAVPALWPQASNSLYLPHLHLLGSLEIHAFTNL